MTLLLPAYAKSLTPRPGNVHHLDCFDLMDRLDPASVDAIITDMPYGTTACSWDTVVDLPRWWASVKRVLRPRGAFVTTASQPFTSALVMSNPAWFRYEWIWTKSNGGGFLNANRQPLKRHENVLVFSDGGAVYFPQFEDGEPYRCRSAAAGETTQDQSVAGWITENGGFRFPVSVIDFISETGLHPTQKPVALYEYLIKTYTQPGEVVLDPFGGSGTTAIAALNTDRKFITSDFTREYVDIIERRIANWKRDSDIEVSPGVVQMGLFANTA